MAVWAMMTLGYGTIPHEWLTFCNSYLNFNSATYLMRRNRIIHFVCKDGTDVYLSGSGEPVFDANGRCTGWWGVCRNASAEMTARSELERSEAMLDRLVRLSPDAICVGSSTVWL